MCTYLCMFGQFNFDTLGKLPEFILSFFPFIWPCDVTSSEHLFPTQGGDSTLQKQKCYIDKLIMAYFVNFD